MVDCPCDGAAVTAAAADELCDDQEVRLVGFRSRQSSGLDSMTIHDVCLLWSDFGCLCDGCVSSEGWSPNEDMQRVNNFRLVTHADNVAKTHATPHSGLRDAVDAINSEDANAPYGNAVAVQLEAFGVAFDWHLRLDRQIFSKGATVRAVLTNGTVLEQPARSVSYAGTNGQDGGWVRLVVTKTGSIRGMNMTVSIRGKLSLVFEWQFHG